MKTSLTHRAWNLMSALDGARAADAVRELLGRAGVTVGGDAPWDLRVHDSRLYARVLRDGSLGLGDAYIEGWWDCDALDVMMDRVLRARLDDAVRDSWGMLAQVARARLFNRPLTRPFEVGERHYDLGNDLYQAMLDRRMVYTCAYWKDAETLDDAQEAKLDLVARKIGARAGSRVLDLGCGWGGFASFIAERYGAEVVGYTVSREQVAWIQERYGHLPIEVRLDDYRSAVGTFDAVVSIGLMEHVGAKNYAAYMALVDRCLAPGGVAFVHTIAASRSTGETDPWFHKHVFPNAAFPSMAQLGRAMEGALVPEDLHNIGPHYDPTLLAWWRRFDLAWPRLRARYGDAFYRMWRYYLLVSAATFRSRSLHLFQLVMTRQGTEQPACRRS
jgi:cyclopropane-fatty-acyl-phospholipid synthase